MDKKDLERLKNLTLFKVCATDKELEEIAPILGIILLIAFILGLGWWGISKLFQY
jgi:hypothetical protein